MIHGTRRLDLFDVVQDVPVLRDSPPFEPVPDPLVNELVTRKQTLDPREERALAAHVLEGLVFVRQTQFRPSDLRQDRFDLGSDQKLGVRFVVVERLLACTVAGREQEIVGEVRDDEREHAVESVEAILAPFQIALQQDF